MTYTRRSFALSLTFHTMMGTLAFWMLTHMNPPPHIERIPFKIMAVPSINHIATPTTQPLSSIQPNPISKISPEPLQSITKPSLSSAPTFAAVPTLPVTQSAIPIPAAKQTITAQSTAATTPTFEIKPDVAAEKRHFLSSLRSMIQNSLRYPPAARRRGIQGEVQVRFTLNENGTISTVNILSGENIFHNAAKSALASASGINIPKNLTDSLPLEIDLTLEFTLKSEG